MKNAKNIVIKKDDWNNNIVGLLLILDQHESAFQPLDPHFKTLYVVLVNSKGVTDWKPRTITIGTSVYLSFIIVINNYWFLAFSLGATW